MLFFIPSEAAPALSHAEELQPGPRVLFRQRWKVRCECGAGVKHCRACLPCVEVVNTSCPPGFGAGAATVGLSGTVAICAGVILSPWGLRLLAGDPLLWDEREPRSAECVKSFK